MRIRSLIIFEITVALIVAGSAYAQGSRLRGAMGGRAGMATSGRRPVLFDTRVASADNARSRCCEMQYAIFLERVTRNRLALNLSVFSNVRRIAKPGNG